MVSKTAEEARAEYERKMGPELGSVFYALFCDISHLSEKLGFYLDLYGKDEATVVVLNRVAPVFFGHIQDVIEHDLLLHISRLTDPATTGGNENLSLQRLTDLCSSATISNEIRSAVNNAVKKSQFSRNWRSLLLAHRDLDVALGKAARKSLNRSRKDMKEVIEAMCAAMNVVAHHYLDTHLGFEYTYTGSAEELLIYLNSTEPLA